MKIWQIVKLIAMSGFAVVVEIFAWFGMKTIHRDLGNWKYLIMAGLTCLFIYIIIKEAEK